MIAHILKLMGRRVGMTTTDGIVIDGRLIKGDMSGPRSAQTVLQNPTVDTAVFEVARGGILREGLGYDRNDVAVVTNVTGDHLGLGGIDTLGQLANVKGVLVEAVPRSGTAVLNADDPLVARMARRCDGKVDLLLDGDGEGRGRLGPRGQPLRARRRGILPGGHDDGELLALRQGRRVMPLIYTHLIPATLDGRARMNVANALAAAAGRLGTRRPPARHPPGPADLHDVVLPGARPAQRGRGGGQGGHRLLPQRGRHAPAGRVRQPRWSRGGARRRGRSADGRAIGVIGIPGDRRDEDMREFGELAATAFDEIIMREDPNLRGRKPGETAATWWRGSRRGGPGRAAGSAGRDDPGRGRAGTRRIDGRCPGDLVVVCADDAVGVYREAMALAGRAQGGMAFADPGELEAPLG